EFIIARASSKVSSARGEAQFAGFYQAPGGRGVLRTGSDTDDEVEITQANQTAWKSGGVRPAETKTFSSPTDILIVTADGDDFVQALGAAGSRTVTPLLVYAGLGADTVFGGDAPDQLDAGPETSLSGLFDFNLLVGNGGSDVLTGSDAKDVLIGDGFSISTTDIRNMAIDLAKGRIRLASANITPTGSGNDELKGGDGFDVLIGGAGDDKLDGGT